MLEMRSQPGHADAMPQQACTALPAPDVETWLDCCAGPIFGGPQVTFGIAQASNDQPAAGSSFVFGGAGHVQQHNEQGNDMET